MTLQKIVEERMAGKLSKEEPGGSKLQLTLRRIQRRSQKWPQNRRNYLYNEVMRASRNVIP